MPAPGCWRQMSPGKPDTRLLPSPGAPSVQAMPEPFGEAEALERHRLEVRELSGSVGLRSVDQVLQRLAQEAVPGHLRGLAGQGMVTMEVPAAPSLPAEAVNRSSMWRLAAGRRM